MEAMKKWKSTDYHDSMQDLTQNYINCINPVIREYGTQIKQKTKYVLCPFSPVGEIYDE